MSKEKENATTLKSFLSSWRKWEHDVRTAIQDKSTFDESKHLHLRNSFKHLTNLVHANKWQGQVKGSWGHYMWAAWQPKSLAECLKKLEVCEELYRRKQDEGGSQPSHLPNAPPDAGPNLNPPPSSNRMQGHKPVVTNVGHNAVHQSEKQPTMKGKERKPPHRMPSEPHGPPVRQLQALSLEAPKLDRSLDEHSKPDRQEIAVGPMEGDKGNGSEDMPPVKVEPEGGYRNLSAFVNVDLSSGGDSDSYCPSSSEESTTSKGKPESDSFLEGRQGKGKEPLEGKGKERLESKGSKRRESASPPKEEREDESGLEEFVDPCERCAEMAKMCLKYHGDGTKTRVKACESCHIGKKKCTHAKRGRPKKASKREQLSDSEDPEPATKRVKIEHVVAGPSRKRGRPKLTEEQKQKNREARQAAAKSKPRPSVKSKATVESDDGATPPPVNVSAEQWIVEEVKKLQVFRRAMRGSLQAAVTDNDMKLPLEKKLAELTEEIGLLRADIARVEISNQAAQRFMAAQVAEIRNSLKLSDVPTVGAAVVMSPQASVSQCPSPVPENHLSDTDADGELVSDVEMGLPTASHDSPRKNLRLLEPRLLKAQSMERLPLERLPLERLPLERLPLERLPLERLPLEIQPMAVCAVAIQPLVETQPLEVPPAETPDRPEDMIVDLPDKDISVVDSTVAGKEKMDLDLPISLVSQPDEATAVKQPPPTPPWIAPEEIPLPGSQKALGATSDCLSTQVEAQESLLNATDIQSKSVSLPISTTDKESSKLDSLDVMVGDSQTVGAKHSNSCHREPDAVKECQSEIAELHLNELIRPEILIDTLSKEEMLEMEDDPEADNPEAEDRLGELPLVRPRNKHHRDKAGGHSRSLSAEGTRSSRRLLSRERFPTAQSANQQGGRRLRSGSVHNG